MGRFARLDPNVVDAPQPIATARGYSVSRREWLFIDACVKA
jgi:hypothetical protein